MKSNRISSREIAFLGLAASLALLLSWVEFLLPPIWAAVPGIKIGLPNVVILYVLYSMDFKRAATVSALRLLISSLLFGNSVTLAYSAAGAALSLLLMLLMKKTGKFSCIGVSVAGGVAHNLGQILVALFLLNTPQIAYYMIILTLTGTLSGIFVGLCGALLVNRVPASIFLKR